MIGTDLSGQRFGRLLVLCLAGTAAGGRTRWRVRCDCGSEKEVNRIALTFRGVTSCGCLRLERIARHGAARRAAGLSPEYNAWRGIHQRCHNKKHKSYYRYGGRGIVVCARWRDPDGYKNFLEDMGTRPGPGFDIERKDNDKGYSKENCSWVSHADNCNNRSTNRLVTLRGETLPLATWATRLGRPTHTVYARLRKGWSIEDALLLGSQRPGPKGAKK